VSTSPHGPVPRQLARVLANLPEKVRVTWADHQLHGTELPVHGWHHIQGEVHLLVTLPDGSRGYLPATATALFDAHEADRPAIVLTPDALRQLRQLVEACRARSGRRQRSAGRKSK
jgi:hypothetical protein